MEIVDWMIIVPFTRVSTQKRNLVFANFGYFFFSNVVYCFFALIALDFFEMFLIYNSQNGVSLDHSSLYGLFKTQRFLGMGRWLNCTDVWFNGQDR